MSRCRELESGVLGDRGEGGRGLSLGEGAREVVMGVASSSGRGEGEGDGVGVATERSGVVSRMEEGTSLFGGSVLVWAVGFVLGGCNLFVKFLEGFWRELVLFEL